MVGDPHLELKEAALELVDENDSLRGDFMDDGVNGRVYPELMLDLGGAGGGGDMDAEGAWSYPSSTSILSLPDFRMIELTLRFKPMTRRLPRMLPRLLRLVLRESGCKIW